MNFGILISNIIQVLSVLSENSKSYLPSLHCLTSPKLLYTPGVSFYTIIQLNLYYLFVHCFHLPKVLEHTVFILSLIFFLFLSFKFLVSCNPRLFSVCIWVKFPFFFLFPLLLNTLCSQYFQFLF